MLSWTLWSWRGMLAQYGATHALEAEMIEKLFDLQVRWNEDLIKQICSNRISPTCLINKATLSEQGIHS